MWDTRWTEDEPAGAAVGPLASARSGASIKMKFALLVGMNLLLTGGVTWYAAFVLEWRVRYGMIVASLIVLAVSQVVGHGMTLPLRQMTAAVRELAAGRPVPAVQTNSRDEVGDLARAFTAMAAELTAVDQQRRQLLADAVTN